MYKLAWTPRFTRSARKFTRNHPALKKQLAEILLRLENDPLNPKLKLHSLKGNLDGLHAVSVTHSHRITLILKITEKAIVLLDIGNHDQVYR